MTGTVAIWNEPFQLRYQFLDPHNQGIILHLDNLLSKELVNLEGIDYLVRRSTLHVIENW